MLREEMQVLGLPGAEDVTDGSVDYYDMDWENFENGVTEEQMAKCIAKECACTDPLIALKHIIPVHVLKCLDWISDSLIHLCI